MPGVSVATPRSKAGLNRRQALSAGLGGGALLAAPALLKAQSPLVVRFVQQRGLLYIPVDVMVSGGVLQQEATKLGLGKIEATATALSGPGPVLDAILSAAADYGTAALPSLLTVWERTRGSANEVKVVGTVSNGGMTLYTINPIVKTLADFGEQDRIAVPTVRLSFNAMMLQMAAEALWGDPHRLDHLTVALGHPDAVTALSAGYGKATITAHIAVQPFTDRGLKLPGPRHCRQPQGVRWTAHADHAAGDQADEGEEPSPVSGGRQRAGGIDSGRQRRQAAGRRALEGGAESPRKHR
jgi:sulfonate transport system substrate-binding protein